VLASVRADSCAGDVTTPTGAGACSNTVGPAKGGFAIYLRDPDGIAVDLVHASPGI
jgi:hypothetical protein